MSFTPNVSSSTQAEAIKVKFIKALENCNQNFSEEIPGLYQALRDLLDIIDFEKVLNSDNINKSLYQQYHGVDGYKDEALLDSEEEVENGASEAVGYLIDTLLALAVILDNAELVQDMLNFGAKVDIHNKPGTVLHCAAAIGNTEVVKLLIDAGSRSGFDIDLQYDGDTPLHLAAQEGHTDVVQILLKSGANPNIKDCDGDTPLHLAVFWGHKDAAVMLIENGADVNIKNNYGTTALEDRRYAEMMKEELLSNMEPGVLYQEEAGVVINQEQELFGQGEEE